MVMHDVIDGAPSEVWALAHTPPPVNGMTLLTAEVVRALKQAGPVVFCNFSPERRQVNIRARISRIMRSLDCVGKLIWNGRVENARLYIASNSRAGLISTALMVWLGQRLGYRVYLHHHAYSYIDTHNRWMAWIDRCMGDRGVHVVHCDKMVGDFRNQYPTRCEFMIIHPSAVSIEIGRPRTSVNKPLRLGMLSNLMIAKGVDLAIETFEALRAKGRDVRLKLAGPIFRRPAQDCIDSALKLYPDAIDYVGPVYGEEKARFLRDIDVFLFPTRYPAESWGIVINEALAAGAPVITINRGCTATVVGDRAGLVVPRDGDYVAAAAQQIEHWMDLPQQFLAASQAAIEQAQHLHQHGSRQLEDFAEHMFSRCDGFTSVGKQPSTN